MTCPKCNYYWCWSCGLPVKHWIHTFSENPFGCKFTSPNGKAMFWKFLIFLLGLIVIPLAFIILPMLAGICSGIYGDYVSCSYICHPRRGNDCGKCGVIYRILLLIISLPIGCIILGLGIGLGALGSGLGAIASIPAIILHTFMFGRSLYWWNKNRNHSNIVENK